MLLLQGLTADPEAVVQAANRELAEFQRIRRWVVWPEPDTTAHPQLQKPANQRDSRRMPKRSSQGEALPYRRARSLN